MCGWGFIVKFNCVHGFFIIEESSPGDVARFMTLFSGIEIVSAGKYFTFSPLLEAFNYSIKGNPYCGVTATATFAGEPWEVMRANGFIYNFNTGKVVPIASVVDRLQINQGSKYYWTEGLPLPGSLNDTGLQLTDYAAWFQFDGNKFKISEATFD